MEDPASTLFWPDGVGIVDGYRADPDRPKQSVPLFICLAGSWGHVQPDCHGTDEAVKFFYCVRVPECSQVSVSSALAITDHSLILQILNQCFSHNSMTS